MQSTLSLVATPSVSNKRAPSGSTPSSNFCNPVNHSSSGWCSLEIWFAVQKRLFASKSPKAFKWHSFEHSKRAHPSLASHWGHLVERCPLTIVVLSICFAFQRIWFDVTRRQRILFLLSTAHLHNCFSLFKCYNAQSEKPMMPQGPKRRSAR